MIDPKEELRRIIRDDYGGVQRNFAKAHNVSQSYISDVLAGSREPGAKVLAAIGLRKVVVYERLERCEN